MTDNSRRLSPLYIFLAFSILIGLEEIATGLFPEKWPPVGKQTWMSPARNVCMGVVFLGFTLWVFINARKKRDEMEKLTRRQIAAITACFTMLALIIAARHLGLLKY